MPVEFLGSDQVLPDLLHQGVSHACVGLGDNALRARVGDRLEETGFALATAVSRDARVAPSATLGGGTLVMPGCVVNARVRIGAGVIVNTSAVVEHDDVVGSWAHLAPGSVITGGVRVGQGALLGAGCVVLPGRTVGDWATVGAGAVVVDDVEERTTVAGVPARRVREGW
jgi:UDP-perosamine 4-acetyltransferase